MRRSLEERFWTKVEKTDGCWNWTAALAYGGYGHFRKSSTEEITAHRMSYILAHGSIPEGDHVLHTCDNRRCVNPDHLFLGTHRDNMDDMVTKGRSSGRTYWKGIERRIIEAARARRESGQD